MSKLNRDARSRQAKKPLCAGSAEACCAGQAANGPPAAADVRPDIEELALACKALGHPARLRIVEHLREAGACICGRIVEVLPLAQSTVSQHLKCLKEAGLVRGEVEGPRVCYCLDLERLDRFKRLAASL